MRNLSTASLAASVHSCWFGGAYLWALVLSALYLCSGSTSFMLRSDGVIGDCTNAPAILAPSRSASLQRNVSHAAPSARHPPFHTSTILSSHPHFPSRTICGVLVLALTMRPTARDAAKTQEQAFKSCTVKCATWAKRKLAVSVHPPLAQPVVKFKDGNMPPGFTAIKIFWACAA